MAGLANPLCYPSESNATANDLVPAFPIELSGFALLLVPRTPALGGCKGRGRGGRVCTPRAWVVLVGMVRLIPGLCLQFPLPLSAL